MVLSATQLLVGALQLSITTTLLCHTLSQAVVQEQVREFASSRTSSIGIPSHDRFSVVQAREPTGSRGRGKQLWGDHVVSAILVAIRCTHLHRMVDATDRNERQIWMSFDDIYDSAITLQDVMQPAGILLPHEPVTVVGAGHNKLVAWPKEVHYKKTSEMSEESDAGVHTIFNGLNVAYTLEPGPRHQSRNLRIPVVPMRELFVVVLVFILIILVGMADIRVIFVHVVRKQWPQLSAPPR